MCNEGDSMKKILLAILCIGVLSVPAFAIENITPLKFIYLNGSNTNTVDSEKDFTDSIEKVHPYLKDELENSEFVYTNMLNNGAVRIDEQPATFFWGFDSSEDLNSVDESLNWMSVFSPRLAQTVRSFISHCMHDAIWVQKSYNMQRVINDLHKDVLLEYHRGKKVVLLGYSAGSFITYEYLIHKLPAMNLNEVLMGKDGIKVKPTCLDAVTSSGMAVYSMNGEFLSNPDENAVKSLLKNLDKYTKEQCAPEGAVAGVINYASPLALFYSDRNNHSLEINRYNAYLFEYLKKNDIFMLTVNFAEDPMGFPIANNMNIDDLKTYVDASFFTKGRGFFYSKSDVKSPATFIGAHLSYWKYPKKFAKMITDGYVEGYKYFYKLE